MAEFIVARDHGYPIENPTHKQLAVIEVQADVAAPDVERGYLIPADPENPRFTPEMATAVVKFRTDKAAAAAKSKADADARTQADKDAADQRAKEDADRLKNPPKDERLETVRKILATTATPAKTPIQAPPLQPPGGEQSPPQDADATKRK